MTERQNTGEQVRARLDRIANRGQAANQRRLRQGKSTGMAESYLSRAIATVARANGMEPQDVAQAYTDYHASQVAQGMRQAGKRGSGSLSIRKEQNGQVIYDASSSWNAE